jgi:hypothetical protein
LLPSLAPPSGYSPPSLSSLTDSLSRVQIDHKGGLVGRNTHPIDNMPDYGSSIAQDQNDAITRLFLNDSVSAKLPLLIRIIQAGIDRDGAAQTGQIWPGGGGYVPGKKQSLAFTATLLNDAAMIDRVKNLVLESDDEGQVVGKNGVVLYGGFREYNPASEDTYWSYIQGASSYAEISDPYGYIDAGAKSGSADAYQFCCLSQPWKGAALSLRMIPAMQAAWGANLNNFLTYVDRWVNQGTHFQPDPCAPVGAPSDYKRTWGPDPSKPGDCIRDTNASDGIGRFPQLHAQSRDDGWYRSDIVDRMWSAYRGTL